MRRVALLLLPVFFFGCKFTLPECSVSCLGGCPTGFACGQDGYCHGDGKLTGCGTSTGDGGTCDGGGCVKYAFVSSLPFDPSTGRDAADALCDREGKIFQPGSYRALLSTSSESAIVHIGTDLPFAWFLTDGSPWVNSITDLFNGRVLSALNLDVMKNTVGFAYVWAGSASPGQRASNPAVTSCNDWSSKSADVFADVGNTSFASSNDMGAFTFFNATSNHLCGDDITRLYCLQVQ